MYAWTDYKNILILIIVFALTVLLIVLKKDVIRNTLPLNKSGNYGLAARLGVNLDIELTSTEFP